MRILKLSKVNKFKLRTTWKFQKTSWKFLELTLICFNRISLEFVFWNLLKLKQFSLISNVFICL